MYSDFLTFKLDQTSALMIERANEVYLQHWNLDVRALRVLRLICAEPGITPKAVSQRALIEKTLLSKTLGDLDTRGLISRQTSETDRRSVQMFATDEGVAIATSSEKVGTALEAELAAALSPADFETLDRLVTTLMTSLRSAAPATSSHD